MRLTKRNIFTLSIPLTLGVVLLFLIVNTCQRFEPEGFLHVETGTVSGITGNSAEVVGEVTNDGGIAVSNRGVCWSTSSLPVISGNKTINGNGTGSFKSTLTGLLPSTLYYVRAYATNNGGTTYGTEANFTTLIAPRTPTVTTSAISEITSTSAVGGGEVTNNGGFEVTARGVCWGTTTGPLISGSKTTDGAGTGNFESTIAGLNPTTKYYIRAYATNSFGTAYGEEDSITTLSKDFTVIDIDGNVYQTVMIGDQLWMAENLKTTRYADGTAIPLVESDTDWSTLSVFDKAYCWNENSTTNKEVYGGLYTWKAATNGSSGSHTNPSGVQGVCPDNWHLPSDEEWKLLEISAGMSRADADATSTRSEVGGGNLKEAGTTHWESPNEGATNETGFTALPAGRRLNEGGFADLGTLASFWTATEDASYMVWRRELAYSSSGVHRALFSTKFGFSVRCVQGKAASVEPSVTTSSIKNVVVDSATGGGEVTYDGGAEVTVRGVCWSTSPGPTISNDTTMDGTGTGSYSSSITGLNSGTTYYIRAYASNSQGTGYGDEMVIRTKTVSGSTVTDYDGNVYQTVQIGEQEWMAENLNVTHYPNGTAIMLVEDSVLWNDLGPGDKAYCWYDDKPLTGNTYGALYTWEAAMYGASGSDASPSGIQGVCPDGMHLPGDAEWKELEMHLGLSQVEADDTGGRGTNEGGKFKEAGTDHWNSPNAGATNESGFTALPGGSRHHGGGSQDLGYRAYFWTATEESGIPWSRSYFYDVSTTHRNRLVSYFGFSVRCVGN